MDMDNNKTKIRFNIMAIILIVILCFAVCPKTFQNDTFYTIKIGENIVKNGIDMHDPFSFHDLEYTYPHWLYDVGVYLIYNIGGLSGVYISTIMLTILLGLTIYFVNVKLTKNRVTSFIITIGSICFLDKFITARAQLVTFILFLLTIYFIEEFLETKKKRYAIGLIIIPIIIANVHTAVFPFYFVLYLPYIAEYLICLLSESEMRKNKSKIKALNKKAKTDIEKSELLEIEKKISELQKRNEVLLSRKEEKSKKAYKITINKNNNIKALIIIMIICVLTGFLTPLGTTPYTYLIKTMQGNTTQNISEHAPLILINNSNYVCVLVIFIAILMFTDTKIRLCDLFMLAGLIVLAFWSRRQESMFLLISGVILNRLVCSMFAKYCPDLTKKLERKMTKIPGILITISLVLIFSAVYYIPKINTNYIDETQYPVNASDYILNNLDVNNIRLYNEYNYGSYLIYRGIPVFVDSRADLYSPEFNKDVNVFTDFLDVYRVDIEDIEGIFNKYGFTHLIMKKSAKLRTVLKQKPETYVQLYEDDYFCVFERKK